MNKGKAALVTIIVMSLLGGMTWCFWSYQIRTYYAVVQTIALYGFVLGGFRLHRWLQTEAIFEKNSIDDEEDDEECIYGDVVDCERSEGRQN